MSNLASFFGSLKVDIYGPQYAHIGGELSSLKDQVATLENDLTEFENVNRRYKDQLVKVKVGRSGVNLCKFWTNTICRQMSDMANNDLEKYAKALDKYETRFIVQTEGSRYYFSAIMKYHSLKMEEVNDTMKHLWNKTYQGTGSYPFHRADGPLDTNYIGFRYRWDPDSF